MLYKIIIIFITYLALNNTGIADTETQTLVYKKMENQNHFEIPEPMGCHYEVMDIVDQRQNKDTLGATGNVPILSKGVDSWLQEARIDIFNNKYLPGAYVGSKEIIIRPFLTRLYAYAEGFNVHGVFALKIEYLVNDIVFSIRRYRGNVATFANDVNVSNYFAAINLSSGDIALKVLNDLQNVCSSLKDKPDIQQTRQVENSTNHNTGSEVDISGTYVSEISSNHSWWFRGSYRNMRVRILKNNTGAIIFKSTPHLEISVYRKGSQLMYSTGSNEFCSCSGIDGEWEISSNGLELTGLWESDSGQGQWKLTKISKN